MQQEQQQQQQQQWFMQVLLDLVSRCTGITSHVVREICRAKGVFFGFGSLLRTKDIHNLPQLEVGIFKQRLSLRNSEADMFCICTYSTLCLLSLYGAVSLSIAMMPHD